MKTINILLISLVTVMTVSSCRTKTYESTSQNVTVNYSTVYDGEPILKNELRYHNANGETFSFSLIAYYISQITLVQSDGTEFNLNNYDLVGPFEADSYNHSEYVVPNGNYTKIKFYVGVPEPANSQAHYDGDLNIALGMSWTWSFGYIFMKNEGNYLDSLGQPQGFSYHLGTRSALSYIELPINLTVGQNDVNSLSIELDIKKMYDSPVFKFANNQIVHSTEDSDKPILSAFRNQLKQSFEVR